MLGKFVLDVCVHLFLRVLDVRCGDLNTVDVKSLDVIRHVDVLDRSVVIEHCAVICGSHSLVLLNTPLLQKISSDQCDDHDNDSDQDSFAHRCAALCFLALVFGALALCLAGTHAIVFGILFLGHYGCSPLNISLGPPGSRRGPLYAMRVFRTCKTLLL